MMGTTIKEDREKDGEIIKNTGTVTCNSIM